MDHSIENLDALQAIERGDKVQQDTLRRLHEAKLIDISNVTHMESEGPEFIFVGFTPEGFRLLKQSKAPLVSDLEREIINAIVRGFLDRHEATSKRALLKKFKSPIDAVLQRLVDRSVLQILNNTYLQETYLPRAIAFYHCGDSAVLAFARKSTELVLRVLRDVFDRDLESEGTDQNQFTPEEVENEARAIDSSIEPATIFTGLFLAQEFSVFSGYRNDDRKVGIVSFSLNERVYDRKNLDWDEHIRRSNVSLVHAQNTKNPPIGPGVPSSRPLDLTRLLPRIDNLDSRKIFLVHGHAEDTNKAVAGFLRSVGLEVIILHEQANQGQTIIEKFEKHSDVGFAVVLLTPDDFGGAARQPEKARRRARQNVILELGYFMAKLGRDKVCCLYVEGVEKPSDYDGVLYVAYNETGAWRGKLAKELTAAGIAVDSENLKKVLSEQPTETEHGSAVRKRTDIPNMKLDHATAESKVNDSMAERRWNRVRDEISKLPEYNREGLRLLLEYPSLTDYTALQKLGQLARQHSLASVLPGLQNSTGLIQPVPGQAPTRQPEYDQNWEIKPELRPFVERYFSEGP